MGGGVITPPYNGWYETYEFELDDQLIKADNLNTNLNIYRGLCLILAYRRGYCLGVGAIFRRRIRLWQVSSMGN